MAATDMTPEQLHAHITGQPLRTGIDSPFNACMYQTSCKATAAEVEALRKDAERYRWHKARNPSILLANAWGASKAACEIGDDPDAATDVAMADAPAVGAA